MIEGQSSPSCWSFVQSYLQIYVQLCTNIDSKSQIVLNQGSVNQVALNSSKYSQIEFKFPNVNQNDDRTHYFTDSRTYIISKHFSLESSEDYQS